MYCAYLLAGKRTIPLLVGATRAHMHVHIFINGYLYAAPTLLRGTFLFFFTYMRARFFDIRTLILKYRGLK